jgi:ubiquinone/menaquinone biosynthesis C-methylase UbiE
MKIKNEQQKNSTINIYNSIAKQYAAIFDNDTSDDKHFDTFLSLVKKGGSILDLGCGTGRITGYFKNKGYDVVGVDLSQEMLAIAKKNYPDIEFRLCDMRALSIPDRSFDALSFSYSLFHLTKQEAEAVLSQAAHILKKDGVLFLVLQEGTGELFVDEPLLPGGKIFLSLYEENEITKILEKTGFTIYSVERKPPQLKGELPYDKMFIMATF